MYRWIVLPRQTSWRSRRASKRKSTTDLRLSTTRLPVPCPTNVRTNQRTMPVAAGEEAHSISNDFFSKAWWVSHWTVEPSPKPKLTFKPPRPPNSVCSACHVIITSLYTSKYLHSLCCEWNQQINDYHLLYVLQNSFLQARYKRGICNEEKPMASMNGCNSFSCLLDKILFQ